MGVVPVLRVVVRHDHLFHVASADLDVPEWTVYSPDPRSSRAPPRPVLEDCCSRVNPH